MYCSGQELGTSNLHVAYRLARNLDRVNSFRLVPMYIFNMKLFQDPGTEVNTGRGVGAKERQLNEPRPIFEF